MLCIENKELFYSPRYEVLHNVKHKVSNNKNNINKQIIKDDLFFIIYMKIHNEVLSINYYNETLEKIKMIEILENDSFKYKYKSKVIENLSDEKINLFTLYHITKYFKINVIWFSDYCFSRMIHNSESNDIFYLKNNYEWTDKIDLENKFEITDLYKPLKSLSYYKLDDLKHISSFMNINEKKKKDIYDLIFKYYENIKLII